MNKEELPDSCFLRLQDVVVKVAGELTRWPRALVSIPEGRHQPIRTKCRHGCVRINAQLALAALLISLLLTGCATPPNARTDLLTFLEPGRTMREEVLLTLGQPSGSFEQDRILTYRIGQQGDQGYFIISPKVVVPAQAASWQNVHFSLVIVFDEQGRLRKHQLVRVD